MSVTLAARDTGKLEPLCEAIGATAFACDASDAAQVARLFESVERQSGEPDVVVYNASARARGPFVSLEPEAVRRTLLVSAYGAFLVAQRAVPGMLAKQSGAVLLTGAS